MNFKIALIFCLFALCYSIDLGNTETTSLENESPKKKSTVEGLSLNENDGLTEKSTQNTIERATETQTDLPKSKKSTQTSIEGAIEEPKSKKSTEGTIERSVDEPISFSKVKKEVEDEPIERSVEKKSDVKKSVENLAEKKSIESVQAEDETVAEKPIKKNIKEIIQKRKIALKLKKNAEESLELVDEPTTKRADNKEEIVEKKAVDGNVKAKSILENFETESPVVEKQKKKMVESSEIESEVSPVSQKIHKKSMKLKKSESVLNADGASEVDSVGEDKRMIGDESRQTLKKKMVQSDLDEQKLEKRNEEVEGAVQKKETKLNKLIKKKKTETQLNFEESPVVEKQKKMAESNIESELESTSSVKKNVDSLALDETTAEETSLETPKVKKAPKKKMTIKKKSEESDVEIETPRKKEIQTEAESEVESIVSEKPKIKKSNKITKQKAKKMTNVNDVEQISMNSTE